MSNKTANDHISEHAHDIVIILDTELRYEYLNKRALKEFLGYTPEELLGRFALEFIHPDDLCYAMEKWNKGLKIGYGESIVRFKHKLGHWIWLENRGRLFENENNEKKALLISRDITKRKEDENKIRHTYHNSELYKKIFIHDMSNILQNLLFLTEFEKYYSNELKGHSKKIFERIYYQVDRGVNLVKDMKKLSTLINSEDLLRKVEVIQYIIKAKNFILESYQNRSISIEIISNFEKLYAMGNELYLDLFENLMINAVKHNNNHNVKIEININKYKVEDINYIKFNFKDNGIGIPDEQKEALLGGKVPRNKKVKGMGIGLTLVSQIVKSFKGEIKIEDRVKGNYSQGSNFVLIIQEFC
ncbi:MAG: PAS domain S-box protein [Candidatus Hodarchaeota archaeon]